MQPQWKPWVELCHLAIMATFLVFASGHTAAASDWVKSDYVDGRLIAATEGTGDDLDQLLAIELKLKPKWKTYWRSPGDAGLPPETDWTGSDNLKSTTLLYPAPVRFQLFGLQTYGYEDRVLFPIEVKLNQANQTANFKVKLNVLVCSDVCVPQTLNLTHTLPNIPATPSQYAHDIQRAVSSVPVSAGVTGHVVTHIETVARDGVAGLEIKVTSDKPFGDLDIIPEPDPFVAFLAPDLSFSSDRTSANALFKLAQPLPAGETLVGRSIGIIVTDGATASESKKTIEQGRGPSQSGVRSWTFVFMLAGALLGGLILNLMPCVLPVLSIKVVSLIQARDQSASAVRAKFLATSAGIVASLLALAGILIAIKALGHAVGWGIHFQQPLFIATMAVIVTLFACNLWGFFEITLPSWVSNLTGSGSGSDSSYLSHFLTGVFVTILATPCSAPFVGTAVGFALASGSAMTLAIFACLGLGLALPYLAIAAAPSVAGYLPRAGSWMVKLRWILGFALLLTAVWLITVLAGQVGWLPTLATGVCLAAIVVLLGLRAGMPGRLSSGAGNLLTVGLAAIAILIPAMSTSTTVGSALDASGPIAWQTFSEKEIRSLVAQGKTIFVDVTADWCITCKANKQLVLNRPPVVDRLSQGLIAMQADWTSPDPEITSFLARFGRYGIPMNVVFGPGSPQGIVLPEILSAEAVMEALRRAERRTTARLSD